jgi:hypothetical protein
MNRGGDFFEQLERNRREATLRHERMCREREQSLLHLLEQAVLKGGGPQVAAVIQGLAEEDREILVERFPDLLSRLTVTTARVTPGDGVDLAAAFRAIEIIRQAKTGVTKPGISEPDSLPITLPDLVRLATKGGITGARGLVAARARATAEKRGFWAILALLVRRQLWFWYIRLKKGAGAY